MVKCNEDIAAKVMIGNEDLVGLDFARWCGPFEGGSQRQLSQKCLT